MSVFSARCSQTVVVLQPFWSSLKMPFSGVELRRKTLFGEMTRNWRWQLTIYAVAGHNRWATVLLGPWTSEPPRLWAVSHLPPRNFYSLSLCPFTIKARTDKVFSTPSPTLILCLFRTWLEQLIGNVSLFIQMWNSLYFRVNNLEMLFNLDTFWT